MRTDPAVLIDRVDRLAEAFCRANDRANDPTDPDRDHYRDVADELLDAYDHARTALAAMETADAT